MDFLAIGIAVVVAVVVVKLLNAFAAWGKRRTPRKQCDHGEAIRGRVHKIVEVDNGMSEITSVGGAGSGTAMVAYSCKKHCPGNCDRRHEAWWKKWR